jgi:4-carboxymuconolactone decarboxylase
MDENERYEAGLKTRRQVLGDAHVDTALAKRTEFTEEFQNLITRYAWGEIWSGPALPRATRSLLTIVMLVALNREEELRLHLRAAIKNGVASEQIKAALLQSAVYCGVPAANSAFRIAQEILNEK